MERPWLEHYDAAVPYTLDYPRRPLYRLLDDAAARHPQRPCINFFGKRLSYAEVKAASDSVAAGLHALGVETGERVALLLPNSPQFPISYYGILKAGAVVLALNPLASEKELTTQLRDAGARTLITIPLFMETLANIAGDTDLRRVVVAPLADFMPLPITINLVVRWRERGQRQKGQHVPVPLFNYKDLLQPAPADFQAAQPDPDDLAVLLYSGGTTGVAKGIMLSHFACTANAHQIAAWGQITEEDRLLAVLPLFHGYGMSVNMNSALLGGGEMILLPRFDARDVLKNIQKYRPTFFTGVPTMFVAFSNLPDVEKYDLSSLEGIFVGAAPLTLGIKEGFESRTGARMIEGYGLTEAVTAIMANPYKGQHKIGSIGLPFSDVDVKIASLETGETLPPGEQGEIVLRSPTLMLGYYRREVETQDTIRDGWLHTGDIGYMDDDGYFYITDRKKDLIIVGGFNVFPREIEEVLYQHPKVKEGVAVGVPDDYAGERIKVFITLKEEETATEEEMIAFFREHLTRYKVPASIEFREELPKSMVGKILRRPLREEEKAKAAAD